MKTVVSLVRVIHIASVLLMLALVPLALGQTNNAEVTRIRNEQCFQSEPNNADITRYRNLQDLELKPNNGDVIRHKNLQSLELAPNDADLIRYRNLQHLELAPNNADVIRYRNSMFFELGPNNADVIRFGNLQYFQLEPLLYEFKINVTSLFTTDDNNNPKTGFLKGDIVQSNFIITNFGGTESLPLTNGLIAVTIQNPNQETIYLAYTYTDLQRGENKNFIFGYKTSYDATPGTYTVKVMIFTDWPSEGGLFINSKTTEFTVS